MRFRNGKDDSIPSTGGNLATSPVSIEESKKRQLHRQRKTLKNVPY